MRSDQVTWVTIGTATPTRRPTLDREDRAHHSGRDHRTPTLSVATVTTT